MDYENYTKEEILSGIKNQDIYFFYLSKELQDDINVVLEAVKKDGESLKHASDKLQDDEDIVLEAMKNEPHALWFASERLQKTKKLLELLEKKDNINNMDSSFKKWYKERMEFLENIRRQEDKEFMEKAIPPSNISSKKVKF